MIALVATLRIDPAEAAAFEAMFIDVARQVRDGEPGNRGYTLARSRVEPGAYRVLELYADDDALNAHLSSDHLRAFRPKLAALLTAPPEMEMLDVV